MTWMDRGRDRAKKGRISEKETGFNKKRLLEKWLEDFFVPVPYDWQN